MATEVTPSKLEVALHNIQTEMDTIEELVWKKELTPQEGQYALSRIDAFLGKMDGNLSDITGEDELPQIEFKLTAEIRQKMIDGFDRLKSVIQNEPDDAKALRALDQAAAELEAEFNFLS